MTREEAIEELIEFKDKSWDGMSEEVIDMAIQALSQEPKILNVIDFAIYASNGDTNYFVGFRNGLRYAESLIDGEEPQFESCAEQAPCDDAVSRILTRMWNCRGKHTTSIDKVAMEQIIRDELPPVTSKSIECEDAISREDALNSLIENTDFEGWELSQALEAIEKLPSVTRQTGEWIVEEEVEDGNRQCRCSVCGHGDIQAHEVEVPYCWFCGSKMLGYAEAE